MPFCVNCGKKTDPGPLCEDCAKAAAPTPAPAPLGSAPAGPATVDASPAASGSQVAAPSARTPFGRRFFSDPAGALREVWVNRNLRPSWLAILWITIAMFLSSFLVDVVRMYLANEGFAQVLIALGRAALAPVPVLCALFLTVLVFASLGRKAPSGQKTTYGKALAGFGAASIPYAIALTVYIPVAIALQFVTPYGIAFEILSYYPLVIVEPLHIGAIALALFACRAVTETTDDSRLAVGGIVALVLQALVLAAVGFLTGLLIPPIGI
jgi:hypothetical protein